jgi:PPK2 family polyphosphate:nucleotide phosphotransferase
MPNKPVAATRLRHQLEVEPGSTVRLEKRDPSVTFGWTREAARAKVTADLVRLAEVQERLWAERKQRLLVVLQGIDAAGKDGTISHVLAAFNPRGAPVTYFGVPSTTELAHDYLWRVHAATPRPGEIAIFNRSHYEDVLIVRVHELVPKGTWSKRYAQINDFERMLSEEGTTIVKFFLQIDRDEQRERLQARYDDPTKRWKVNAGDLAERARWDDYIAAFDDALTRCSTKVAPWYVIPANRKWFRDLAVGEILLDVLEELHPAYPRRDDLPPGVVVT